MRQQATIRVRMTPGQMLHTLRKLQEMTQDELAEASGVFQSAISAVEAGREELGLERAKRLAEALKVHPAVLLFPDWEPTAAREERLPAKHRVARAPLVVRGGAAKPRKFGDAAYARKQTTAHARPRMAAKTLAKK